MTGGSHEYRTPHPEFGWILEANASYTNLLYEESIPVIYNSQGWRDTEHSVQKPGDKTRIVVLGDSFMEGYSVRLEDLMSKRLEHLSDIEGYKTEVINLGVGGYGTLQQYLVYKKVGRLYQPDIVLLGFYFGNDLRDNSYELGSMFLNRTSIKLSSRPFLRHTELPAWRITQVDYDGAMSRYTSHKEREKTLTETIAEKSALFVTAHEVYKKIKARYQSMSIQDENSTKRALERHLAQFGQYYCDEPAEYKRAWEITGAIIQKLDQVVSEDGAELVVFTVPALNEVDPSIIRNLENQNMSTPALCVEAAPSYLRLMRLLDELDVTYLDLLPDFRRAMRQDSVELFRRSDAHWNELGHDLAAKKIHALLM
jgi:hypothetical protein